MRPPRPLPRYLLLLVLWMGMLAPAVSLALGPVDPLVGVCRSADDDSPRAMAGWFEHCASCGALDQVWGAPPLQELAPPVPALAHVPAGRAHTPEHSAPRCAQPPARAPPQAA